MSSIHMNNLNDNERERMPDQIFLGGTCGNNTWRDAFIEAVDWLSMALCLSVGVK